MADKWQADKIYDRCAYLNCYNGKYSTGHRLFRFPAYSDSRHHLWIRYTGNVRLRTWSSATIRRAGICGEHFGPESFTDETRRSLRRHAVPKPYSSNDDQAKPSPTLLAHIKSLPREETRSLKNQSASVRGHIFDAVQTLCKVKTIKINEQKSNSNHTIILERCKNPEACPVNPRPGQSVEKPRPHFHKVYVDKSLRASSTSGIRENKLTALDKPTTISEKLNVKSCEELETEEKSNDEAHRLERYLINVTKTIPRKRSSICTDREHEYACTLTRNEVANSSINIQDIHSETSNANEITVTETIPKTCSLTKEFVDDYYRSKKERSFDRCMYLNCKNSKATGTRLFRFPQNTDSNRAKAWIKSAGNPRMLYWSWSTIRRAGLCSDHFATESFFNETRQRLLRTAVPIPFYANESPVERDAENTFGHHEKKGIDESTKDMSIDRDDLENEETLDTEIIEGVEDCENGLGGKHEAEQDDNIGNEMSKDPFDHLYFPNDNIMKETDEEESEQVNDIDELVVLHRPKVQLCKTIERFSAKLERATIRKNKPCSRLLAHIDSSSKIS